MRDLLRIHENIDQEFDSCAPDEIGEQVRAIYLTVSLSRTFATSFHITVRRTLLFAH